MASDPDTAKRRFAFQKSYSLEHGGSWRHKSLIEDAKFETVTNAEFEKRENRASQSSSIAEDDSVVQNGNPTTMSFPAAEIVTRKYSIMLSLKEEMNSLARIIRIFETSKVNIDHIESRVSKKVGAQYEVLIRCGGTRENVVTLAQTLKLTPSILEMKILQEKETESKPLWFPKHISALDQCTHIVTKFEPELDCDHPGFTDKAYRARRKQIADIAFDYKHGQVIPRIEYTEDEIKTWGHVFKKLKELFPTHACREHREVFAVLEKECGYDENKIPQLEDVSTFLKRKTGFQLRPVSGLLSARDFLSSLAFRVFQCTQYVRHSSKPTHSPEPDCIHELLGHIPMLADPGFAQFSQEIGLASLGVSDEDIEKFSTLYWFTVEFGLLKQDGEIRAYGAGILSSYGELLHALSEKPTRKPFEPATTAVQAYRDEDLQPIYFVAESFDDMKEKMRKYAAKIPRPCELRYDPLTQSIQELNNHRALASVTVHLKVELECLQRAISRIQTTVCAS